MLPDDLVVCAVCHSELPLDKVPQLPAVVCPACKQVYTCQEGVLDLTPIPPPDVALRDQWHLWEQLQFNGTVVYEKAPERNLSIGEREDARAFGKFCQLSGVVLDVGCGPQDLPSYGMSFSGRLVGIDPLRGVQPKRFHFVQGIGEYLPFRPATFDRVLFATTLDHMLLPKRALAEALRVLKPSGTANIWFGEPRVEPGPVEQPVAKLDVPEGAADAFHIVRPSRSTVEAWLEEAGFNVLEATAWQGSRNIFVRAAAIVASQR